tara:strand:+ start:187 stop:534 length:348 start_codon:yes stop_codon:yes gene_type:complete
MTGCDICGHIWDICECDNIDYRNTLDNLAEKIDNIKEGKPVMIHEPDLGSHYRHEFRGVKIDPYRILTEYDVTCPVAQHIIKKLLRGESKGHSNEEVWNEVKQAVDRKFEMMEEG